MKIYPLPNNPSAIEYVYVKGEKLNLEQAINPLLEMKNEALKKLEITTTNNESIKKLKNNKPEKIIKTILNELSEIPRQGRTLDVGYGTNNTIMNYLRDKGYKAEGIDVIYLPDVNEQAMYNNPASKQGLAGLQQAKTGEVTRIGIIDGTVRYMGNMLDMKNEKYDLIYYWASWSSHSHNLTVDFNSKKYFYDPPFQVEAVTPGERLAEVTHKVKQETIKKTRELLNKGGTLMITNPVYAKLGTGYYNTNDMIIDYIELLHFLNNAGLNKINLIGQEYGKHENTGLARLIHENEIINPLILTAQEII